ncbi:MAG: hypothetical protein ABEK01_02365 [Candidatus Nanohaloarchaea archaeon]
MEEGFQDFYDGLIEESVEELEGGFDTVYDVEKRHVELCTN